MLVSKVARMLGKYDRSNADYPYDESKYKGFWKYYNSETPRGRGYAALINLSSTFIGVFILVKYLKSRKSDKK